MGGLMARWRVEEQGWRKGPWTAEEDKLLIEYVSLHGEGRWSSVARSSGLNRSGKSCRLRWVNYLRPGLKKGHLTPQEEGIIVELHALWGNKWSRIAQCLPGRTDNEIKNYWRTHFKNNKSKYSLQNEKKPRVGQQQQQQQQQQEQPQSQSQQTGGWKEKVFMYPNLEEDQCFPTMFHDGDAFLFDSKGEEDMWDGFWNLDHVHAQFNHHTFQNEVVSLNGGDFNLMN